MTVGVLVEQSFRAGRGKLLGDEQGVSEGRGACQAADCRREKQERKRGLTTDRGEETEHR